jgi:F-type H+-transporting ATPase subunit delta
VVGTRVSRRYARALFELALEKNYLDRVAQDLKLLENIYQESKDFTVILESPVIHNAEKKKIFTQLFEGKVHALTFYFLNLLLKKNRESLLPKIIQFFMDILDESRGIVRSQLLTAYPFTDMQLASLKSHLDRISGKNVVLEQSVDEQLLGGFIVRMDDRVIDNSILNQLSQLRENLISKD